MRTVSESSRDYGSSRINTWLLATLVALMGYFCWQQAEPPKVRFDPQAEPRPVTPRGDLASDEQSTIALFKRAAPAVVHITTTSVRQNYFTRDVIEIPAGTGSGILWDDKGHVVTNLHVIQNAQRATVTLHDNTSYEAGLVGFDADHDLALLKITAPPSKLVAIELGTSKDLQVGQKAFAIGSPFEFDMTLTTGIISGIDRTIRTERASIHGAIQTDAAVNPGNSGGPLLDSAGRLIGLNTAIVTQSGGSHGIGFALPVDVVNLVVVDLLRDGSIDRPWLGVVVVENLVIGGKQLEGLAVRFVAPDSPAARAGLRAMEVDPSQAKGFRGDRILRIDGEPVASRRDLLRLLAQRRAGETIKLTVIRDERHAVLPVELEMRPSK